MHLIHLLSLFLILFCAPLDICAKSFSLTGYHFEIRFLPNLCTATVTETMNFFFIGDYFSGGMRSIGIEPNNLGYPSSVTFLNLYSPNVPSLYVTFKGFDKTTNSYIVQWSFPQRMGELTVVFEYTADVLFTFNNQNIFDYVLIGQDWSHNIYYIGMSNITANVVFPYTFLNRVSYTTNGFLSQTVDNGTTIFSYKLNSLSPSQTFEINIAFNEIISNCRNGQGTSSLPAFVIVLIVLVCVGFCIVLSLFIFRFRHRFIIWTSGHHHHHHHHQHQYHETSYQNTGGGRGGGGAW